MTLNYCYSKLLFAALALIALSALSIHAQPSGGKLPPEAGRPVTKPSKTATKPANVPAKGPARKAGTLDSAKSKPLPTGNSSRSAALAPGAIEGKWWTTGNGFGDSEVVLTQTGTRVSGVIRYADGRTGTIDGNIVGKRLLHSWTNSSNEGGTGWLELSWNNFLGGPWRNQRVRDGSWSLSRVEGKWCFGGSRARIRSVTHDARGRMTSVAEDGTVYEGRLEGPLLYLDSDMGSIEGTMNFRRNRVEWSSGFLWTWCGR